MTLRLFAKTRGNKALYRLLLIFLFLFCFTAILLKINIFKLEHVEENSPSNSNGNNLEEEEIVSPPTVGVDFMGEVKFVTLPSKEHGSPDLKLVTQGGEDPDPEVYQKRLFIKKMMEDAWGEYKKYAWGTNELMPMTRIGRTGGDIYGNVNLGATIIDSLSTLFIMGMDDEFEKARTWVEKEYNLSEHCNEVSLFETNIRILGGFLSAFALTNDTLFLEKAKDVGERLLPAFDTSTGIPHPRVRLCRPQASGSEISIAELGSLHLEFVYLSILTKDYRYYDKVYKLRRHLRKIAGGGVYHDSVSIYDGQFTSSWTSIGGGADSFYEYLVKSWIQLGKAEDLEMYHTAIQAMIDAGMMRTSPQNHFLYFGKVFTGGQADSSFSHLACFAGAMFALGSVSDRRSRTKTRDMDIAKNLTNTCHESYDRAKTKLGPESFSFRRDAEAMSSSYDAQYYILRPEVVESYFTLYRLTGENKYREWGWEAAQAIEKYCKAREGGGYSGITNVNNLYPHKDDVQQTFFLAETLKYLYLLFSSPNLIHLDNWVFNTEAHPLPVKGKNPMFSPFT